MRLNPDGPSLATYMGGYTEAEIARCADWAQEVIRKWSDVILYMCGPEHAPRHSSQPGAVTPHN